MGRITLMFKRFLFLGLLLTVGVVTNSMAQDSQNGRDDWLRGKEVGCPGGFYLDFIPHFEQMVADHGGTINGDGWVCIKSRGPNGYVLVDNAFPWPPQ